MLKATVVGNVWSTKRVHGLPNGALLEVEVEGGSRLVAFDVLGSGVGEEVLVVQGSVASAWFGESHPPVDALIIGSVDPQSTRSTAAPAASSPGDSTPTSPDPAQPGPER